MPEGVLQTLKIKAKVTEVRYHEAKRRADDLQGQVNSLGARLSQLEGPPLSQRPG